MAKYIDADIIRNHFKADLSRRPKSFLDDMLMVCVDRVIETAPAADVVEVVRCKNCKHREYDDFIKELICDLDAADPYERSRCAEDDEWFCKDGERKDG